MKNLHVISFLTLFVVMGCSDGALDRPLAKEILEQKWGEGYESGFIKLDTPYCTAVGLGSCTAEGGVLKDELRSIVTAGNQKGYWDTYGGRSSWGDPTTLIANPDVLRKGVRLFPSDDAEKYLQIGYYTWRVGEVTGIRLRSEETASRSSDDCDAIVEFLWERSSISEFGDLVISEHREDGQSECFQKYDEGWRIRKRKEGGPSMINQQWW